jgi:tetratricopeptide (TPR) repeat protein
MARNRDEYQFALIFNLIRLKKGQGMLVFLTCRKPGTERILVSKLKEELAGEFSFKELTFDTGDYDPIDYIAVVEEQSPKKLYIISGFPFEIFYSNPTIMEEDIKRLLNAFNIRRDHISALNLKIIIICPPELEDRMMMKAPDFYRFSNYSADFSEKEIEKTVNHGSQDKLKKIDFLLNALKTTIREDHKADLYFELGKVYYELTRFEKAVFFLEKAEIIYKKAKNKKKMAGVLGYMGKVYSGLEQPKKSMKYVKESERLSRELNLPGKAF